MWKLVAFVLILAVASALTFFAFTHPGGYRRLFKWLLGVCLGTFLLLLGYGFGHFRAQVKTGKHPVTDKHAVSNGLPFSEHQMILAVFCIVIFLLLLRWLPELTKRDKK